MFKIKMYGESTYETSDEHTPLFKSVMAPSFMGTTISVLCNERHDG